MLAGNLGSARSAFRNGSPSTCSIGYPPARARRIHRSAAARSPSCLVHRRGLLHHLDVAGRGREGSRHEIPRLRRLAQHGAAIGQVDEHGGIAGIDGELGLREHGSPAVGGRRPVAFSRRQELGRREVAPEPVVAPAQLDGLLVGTRGLGVTAAGELDRGEVRGRVGSGANRQGALQQRHGLVVPADLVEQAAQVRISPRVVGGQLDDAAELALRLGVARVPEVESSPDSCG